MRSRPLIAVCLCLLALCLDAGPAGADTSAPVGSAPELPEGATLEGPVAPGRPLALYVALQPRDPEALRTYAEEVTTPGSPVYGQYLSVPEFAQRFGPSSAAVATVRHALEAEGLEVGELPANHLSLPVEATAEEAEAAFGIHLRRIQNAEGEAGFINTGTPELAAGAAPYVTSVLGLADVAQPHRSRPTGRGANPLAPRSAATGPTTAAAPGSVGPQPCAEASAVATETPGTVGYTAEKFAAAYGFDKFYAAGNLGAGQTIALYEQEPFKTSDIEAFQQCYGTHTEVESIDVGPEIDPKQKEEGEANLDVEQAIQLAPEAHVLVYRAGETESAEAEILAHWTSDNWAKVMSDSYGWCEKEYPGGKAGMATINTLLQEAATQGQTFVVASGDYGAADCSQVTPSDKTLQVDYPGSDPFATDVGGTRLEEPTAARPIEYLWNEAPDWGAGGGGISTHFPMPSYQQEATPSLGVLNTLSSGKPCGFAGPCRQVPDVSADASANTGYIVYYHGGWEVTGGTSAAAPLWGALATLTNASPACDGHTVGFLNPALYSIAGTDYAANFRDIVEGKPGGPQTTNRDEPGKPYPAAVGYDMATGIGAPIGNQLAASLCALVNPVAPPAPQPAPVVPVQPAPIAKPAPVPAAARIANTHSQGIAKGKPRIDLTVTARDGARLQSLTITLPKGMVDLEGAQPFGAGIIVRDGSGKALTATLKPGARTIQVRLGKAAPTVKLTLRAPAITVPARFEKPGGKVPLVVTTRETGGHGARLPLQLST